MPRLPTSFEARSRQAIGLSNQRGALLHTTAVLAAQRRTASQALPDWADLTARCTELRRHTIAHLGFYLEALEKAIQARGGQVIWARNSGEACQAIIALAQRAGVTQVVQTRSVLPLEIGLPAALRGAGLTTFLLNQGEFLAELSGQRPAHPNAGVANLRLDDIVRTLHAKLDMPVFLNAHAANRIVRGRTRQAVLQSGLAVMGIDFAVAETGALALFNDQGDVRLASALAPLQVAIMGLEQIVPTFDDLWLLLGVHTQRQRAGASTYVELLSGAPTPVKFHLILLDNGRSHDADRRGGRHVDVYSMRRVRGCVSGGA